MRADTAAAYLDVSATTFRTRVAQNLPAVRLSSGIVGYLRDDLDRWLDAQPRDGAPSAPGNPWHA